MSYNTIYSKGEYKWYDILKKLNKEYGDRFDGVVGTILEEGEEGYENELIKEYDKIYNKYLDGEHMTSEYNELAIAIDNIISKYPGFTKTKPNISKVRASIDSTKRQDVFNELTRKQLENLLFDAMYSILTSDSQFVDMIKGVDLTPLKNAAKNVVKAEGSEDSIDFFMDINQQVKVRSAFMAGKNLVGIFASNSANHSILQHYNVNIDNDVVIDGMHSTKISPVMRLSGDGTVTNSISTFLATVVDNGKNLIAGMINCNEFTAGPYNFLLRLGFDIDTVVYFMSQPILKQVASEVISSSNIYNYSDIVNKHLSNLESKINNNRDSRFKEARNNFNKDTLLKSIKMGSNKDNWADDEDFVIYQHEILKTFAHLKEKSEVLLRLTMALRGDTYGGASNLGELEQQIRAMKSVLKEDIDGIEDLIKIYDTRKEYKDGIKNIKRKQSIAAIFNSVIELHQYLNSKLPFMKGKYMGIKNIIESIIRLPLKDATINRINMQLLNYAISRLDYFYTNPFTGEKTTQKYITSKEFVDKIIDIIDNDEYLSKENKFTSKIRREIINITKSTKVEKKGILRLSVSNFEDQSARNAISRDWEVLYKSNNDTYRQLAEALLIYNFQLTGMGFGPFSMSNFIPVVMKESIPGYINALKDANIFNDENEVADIIFRTNYYDNDLVPDVSSELKDGVIKQLRSKNETYGISISINNLSQSIAAKSTGKMSEPVRYIKIINKDGSVNLFKLNDGITMIDGEECFTFRRVEVNGTRLSLDYRNEGIDGKLSDNVINAINNEFSPDIYNQDDNYGIGYEEQKSEDDVTKSGISTNIVSEYDQLRYSNDSAIPFIEDIPVEFSSSGTQIGIQSNTISTSIQNNKTNSTTTLEKETSYNIEYTPVGKTKQNYTIKKVNGRYRIYNSKGAEVFSVNNYDNKDARKIFANLAIKQGRAVVVEHKDKKYVVNRDKEIISVTTGDLMKWDDSNGDRRNIIRLADAKFKELNQNTTNKSRESKSSSISTGYNKNESIKTDFSTLPADIVNGELVSVFDFGNITANDIGGVDESLKLYKKNDNKTTKNELSKILSSEDMSSMKKKGKENKKKCNS